MNRKPQLAWELYLKMETHMWKPIAFASRSLTQTEQYYATIEKEALAITWACEKFASYIVGMKFHIETDHKPLIPLLKIFIYVY